MNDYMGALHQRFYREPDFSEEETERICHRIEQED